MRIKSMTATFGKLNRAHLELSPGLNLIQAPNESGKSTWCAFWKTMLYGLDTRDRDKKGYLAAKNRYQPWSGASMEGEIVLEWQGRDITIRRGPRGITPFGAFSATYTGTGEPVPGLTSQNCGLMLTGVGREVFERSAFLGGDLTVSAAPELERRIAALVSSGQEDISFSQAENRLREWINRRRVNRSVGLIPKLEQELEQVSGDEESLHEVSAHIAQLEAERTRLEQLRSVLSAEADIHQRLAQKDLNRRFAQAGEELSAARVQLNLLEREAAKYAPMPTPAAAREAQGNLQYLKILDEEIKGGQTALREAEEAYVQAQIAAQDEHFPGLSGEDARKTISSELKAHAAKTVRRKTLHSRGILLCGLGGLALLAGLGGTALVNQTGLAAQWFAAGFSSHWLLLGGGAVGAIFFILSVLSLLQSARAGEQAAQILSRYHADSSEQLTALAEDYTVRCQTADEAAARLKSLRGTLSDRMARRENIHADLMAFVHTFAPQVTDLFGCSAALSRVLSLDHELALARERVFQRQRRRDDLAAQGGRDFDTLELLHAPDRTPEETHCALSDTLHRLEQVNEQLNQYRGRQNAMGDPAALAAKREELENTLTCRQRELDALTTAMSALQEANTQLQERFSPELNRLAGQYLAQLTGNAYSTLTLNRDLEGAAIRPGDVLPHSALYLSRGTVDQLYLAVRLAVCALCLPDRPPLVLDDALISFDDHRLTLALELLGSIAQKQQILLFTCQVREGTHLTDLPRISL